MSALTGPRTTTRTVDLHVYEEVDEALPFDLRVRLRLVLLASTARRALRRAVRGTGR